MKEEYSEQEYWADVEAYAEECVQRAKNEGEDIYDVVHETADGSPWVFMYYGAEQTLRWSRNHNAMYEEGMGDGPFESVEDHNVKAAYWALARDIQEAIPDDWKDDEDEN